MHDRGAAVCVISCPINSHRSRLRVLRRPIATRYAGHRRRCICAPRHETPTLSLSVNIQTVAQDKPAMMKPPRNNCAAESINQQAFSLINPRGHTKPRSSVGHLSASREEYFAGPLNHHDFFGSSSWRRALLLRIDQVCFEAPSYQKERVEELRRLSASWACCTYFLTLRRTCSAQA